MAWDRSIITTADQATYWNAQSRYSDAVISVAPGNLGVSRVTHLFSRTTPAGTREDLASFSLTLAIRAAAGTAVYLTDAQKADAETPLKAFIDRTMGECDNSWQHERMVWHDWKQGEPTFGPADRTTSYLKLGSTPGSRLPDQLAVTVTLKTAARKHWGRYYIGGLTRFTYDVTYGRVVNAGCDGFASSCRTLQLALMSLTAQTELVVFSLPHQGVLSVDEIQCDNVADVIRRRRAKQASYKKVFTS